MSEIQENAAAAKARGTQLIRLNEIALPKIEGSNATTSLRIHGLPQLTPDSWDKVDGTIPYSKEDEAARFRAGPRWSNNSCAVDTFMTIVLLANGGRCRIDQVDSDFMHEKAPRSEIVRIFQKPWSQLSTENIAGLRDLLRTVLYEVHPDDFKKDAACSLYDVFDWLGPAFPQFVATWGSFFRCCPDGEWHLATDSGGNPIQQFRVGLDHRDVARSVRKTKGLSIPEAIRAVTGIGSTHVRERNGISRCKGARCTDQSAEGIPVVYDRLPPMLVLMRGFESEDGLREGVLDTHDVDYFRLDDEDENKTLVEFTATYEPWGVVAYNGSHYTLYATRIVDGVRDFIFYDGMRNLGRFKKIESLEEGLKRGRGNSAVVYKVISRRAKNQKD
jgi:hypothetical protein